MIFAEKTLPLYLSSESKSQYALSELTFEKGQNRKLIQSHSLNPNRSRTSVTALAVFRYQNAEKFFGRQLKARLSSMLTFS